MRPVSGRWSVMAVVTKERTNGRCCRGTRHRGRRLGQPARPHHRQHDPARQVQAPFLETEPTPGVVQRRVRLPLLLPAGHPCTLPHRQPGLDVPNAFARDVAKSRMTCCCGTLAPCASHGVTRRASVSILSSCAGPHVSLSSERTLLCRYTALDLATHSFQIQRHRTHSASSAARAPAVTRRRYEYRTRPASPFVVASAVMNPNLSGRTDSREPLIKAGLLTPSVVDGQRPRGDRPFPAPLRPQESDSSPT